MGLQSAGVRPQKVGEAPTFALVTEIETPFEGERVVASARLLGYR